MNKEQQIKEIIESVQKAADEALQKIKELEKESESRPWTPEMNEDYCILSGNGVISVNSYYNESDTRWLTSVAECGRIAPATEEGRKTLEKRDEWFRFMFKFMTAGDVAVSEKNRYGYYIDASGRLVINSDGRTPNLGQNKFSTNVKLITFVESFGDGDYDIGLEYIRKMLTGGLR